MKEKKCIVVIPVYTSLKKREQYVIQNAIETLTNFDVVFICPRSFLIAETYDAFSGTPFIRFDDKYFASKDSYNLLMLLPDFYQTFQDYEYILIHQTDAFVFRNELQKWCDDGYDYVGATWYRPQKLKARRYRMFMGTYFSFLYKPQRALDYVKDNNVGNGGLSLRKVSTFIQVLNTAKIQPVLEKYRTLAGGIYNEDIFWAIEVPRINKAFKKPTWNEALKFAIETAPIEAYKEIGNQLPFGCHAFEVYEPLFWNQFILK